MVALCAVPLPPAAAAPIVEGVDFKTLARAQPVESPPGKLEVVEFFGYWCPHCQALEADLLAWRARQAPDVSFRRIPVAFRPNQAIWQHTYYALEAMGKADAAAPALFASLHSPGKKPPESLDEIADVLAKSGVERARFVELAGSFSIQAKSRRSIQAVEAYGIDGVPTLVVAGRWMTSPSLAGGHEKALHALDELLARERLAKR
jgi:thiol:disulfide interchange protein DsbA